MGLFSSESFLGIDIASSGIKIVELKKEGGGIRLVTYGFSASEMDGKTGDWHESISQTAGIIREVMSRCGAASREAAASLPSFSVFSSIINLSGVEKKDIDSAVRWQAKKLIPLPAEETVLSWSKISEKAGEKKEDLKVLLTGAPQSLVKKYVEIFRRAKLNLRSLETETFPLIRALLANDPATVMVVDMGTKVTDIIIVERNVPILSRSIDIGGLTITDAVSHVLGINLERAEQFKYDLGLSGYEAREEEVVPKTIMETITPVVNEIKYTLNLFSSRYQNKVEKIVLSGGSALLVNFAGYLTKALNIQTIAGDPWARVSYPADLKIKLEEIGPKMAVAIGLAMKGLT